MKILFNLKSLSAFILLNFVLFSFSHNSLATVTKVGNGNDGSDLENVTLIKDGKIFNTKIAAIELLNKLNTDGIKGLGSLKKEVEISKLYISTSNIKTKLKSDLSPYHSNFEGKVYARTIAEPYAPTRFFPVSLDLTEKQLVSLHIHEALHRSLPEEIREDESKVSELTLAITSPDSTHDRVREATLKIIPQKEKQFFNYVNNSIVKTESKEIKNPSQISLSPLYYLKPQTRKTREFSLPIKSSLILSSYLYPFGQGSHALGTGIDMVLLMKEDGTTYLGPLGLSLRLKLLTIRDFNFEGFVNISLNTLSNEELSNSMLGRDIGTFGITMNKMLEYFYIVNDFSYTLGSSVSEKIGPINYNYEFPGIVTARIKAGGHFKNFHLGGFAEVYLTEDFEVSGGAYNNKNNIGRIRVVTAGPEIFLTNENFQFSIYGRLLIDSTKDVDFDHFGNILGIGLGQGYLGAKISLFF